MNGIDVEGSSENVMNNESDQPTVKKTKSGSRSRRRKKGRRSDTAVAMNGGSSVICEFVRGGGGGRVHNSSGARRDWFSVDATCRQGLSDHSMTGATNDSQCSADTAVNHNSNHRDGVDRKKTTSTPVVNSSSKLDRSDRSVSTVMNQGNEAKSQRLARANNYIHSADTKKVSVSKEFLGDKRQCAAPKTSMSASTSDVHVSKNKAGLFDFYVFSVN